MQDVLPQHTGLVVTSVSYRYVTIKNTQDHFTVQVQNYNTNSAGYTFRNVDDWSGLPSNTIVKTIPVNNIGLQYWGRGEILATGIGTIKDPYVSYSYRYDTCSAVPVVDTSCPNYKPTIPQNKNLELATQNGFWSATHSLHLQEAEEILQKQRSFVQQAADEITKVNSVSRGSNKLITAQVIQQSKQLELLDSISAFPKYNLNIPGGVYPDSIKYKDTILPDSRNSRRLNMSQQQLYNKLLELQYSD